MLTLGIISGLLNLIGTLIYAVDVIKRKSRPERATWFIWSLLGIIAFLSQKSFGAEDSLWFTGLQTAGVAIIFVLSIRYGQGGMTRNDLWFILLAALGIAFWVVTNDALLSLIMVVVVRSIGVSLTILKTYKTPRSEAVLPWLIYAFSAIIALVSVGELRFELLLYPAYVLIADSSVLIAKFHKSLLVLRVG